MKIHEIELSGELLKIQGIGEEGTGMPFSSHQSSCSNRKPKNFEWTD